MKLAALVKNHIWTLLFIALLLIGSSFVVKTWKSSRPGSMTVVEAQAMDMTQMKPPTGSVPVAAEIVHPRPFIVTVSYTGSVAPLEEQVIYPRVDGLLKDMQVYNGDTVAKGQLLAVIESPDLQTNATAAAEGHAAAANATLAAHSNASRMAAEKSASDAEINYAKSELAQAKAGLVAKQKAVVQAEKQVASAQANADYWRAEIKRESNLLKSGAVSQQEYQSEHAQAIAAGADLEGSKAAVEAAQADLDAMRAEIAGKVSMLSAAKDRASASSAASAGAKAEIKEKAAMTRQAGAMADTASVIDSYRKIHAPFAGAVTVRYVSPGQFVKTDTAILTVAQIDKVRLQANVPDTDVRLIHIGDAVTAHFAKDPKLIINAVVTSVTPKADQESRTSVVEAIVPNPDHKLVPGDSVTLEIAVSKVDDAITVPLSAVVQNEDQATIWTVKSTTRGKVTYYCTMHPEVTSSKLGDCPKCGMKLVPQKSSGDKTAHRVNVTLGPGNGDRVQVITGLQDGDEVIYRGNTYLQEGDTVSVGEWTSEGPEALPPAPAMDAMAGMPGMNHKSMQGMPKNAAKDMTGEEMAGMPGMDHKSMQGMPEDAAKGKTIKKKIYTCPMHPEVIKNKPGKCPKCGMKLVLKKPVDKNQKTYVCPMHPEVTSHDPKAQCPKCGMNLEEKKDKPKTKGSSE